jgi:hypothetical protein
MSIFLNTKNGWMFMSDEDKHQKYSKMLQRLNRPTSTHQRVRPTELGVKKNMKNWNNVETRVLLEFVDRYDKDDIHGIFL